MSVVFRGFPRAIKDKGDAQSCLDTWCCPICGSDIELKRDHDAAGPTAWFECTASHQQNRKKKIHHTYQAVYDSRYREYDPVIGDDYGR